MKQGNIIHSLGASRVGPIVVRMVLTLSAALLMVVPYAMANAHTTIRLGATPDFATIDSYVQSKMQATHLPGLALGIVHGDQVVHLKGFGIANSSGRPVTPETPFTIGSTTKSFTALAIMQLVEAGKVDLDASVQQYVPWFQVADAGAATRITVRHLLNQTSGFPTLERAGELRRSDSRDIALESYVRALRSVQLVAPVGSSFHYSNTNFDVLGLIVQMVSGQPYEQYVQSHIFAPLDMRHSFTSPEAARAAGRATGHRYWFGRPVAYERPYNRAQFPAGFINASAEDVTHYLIAQLNGGRYRTATLLSAAGVDALHQPATPTGDGEHFYGMGWFVGTTNDIPTVSHGGSTANFHANLVLVPQEKWGVVLLMNSENGLDGEPIAMIADGITSLLIGKQPQDSGAGSDARSTLLLYTLIVLAVQLLGLIRSGLLIRRWQREPVRRPHGFLRIGLRTMPPLVLSLVWLVAAFMIVPLLVGNDLLDMLLFVPDLGYTLALSLTLALGWGLFRPVLIWMVLHSHGPQATNQVHEITGSAKA
jgi:CubicO group peptidase (beta-lactamase class C family)